MIFVYANFNDLKMYQKFVSQRSLLLKWKEGSLYYCFSEFESDHQRFGGKMHSAKTCYKFRPDPGLHSKGWKVNFAKKEGLGLGLGVRLTWLYLGNGAS